MADSKTSEKLLHELQVHQVELELQNEELKRVRAELEESLSRYADLYDSAPVGYFSIQSNGKLLQANATGAALLGMAKEDVEGSVLAAFVLEEDRSAFARFFTHLFSSGVHGSCQVRIRDFSGALLHVRFEGAVSALSGHFGRLVMIDITREKTLEDQLLRAQRMETIGTLAGGVAHDLNNILAPVLLTVPILRSGTSDADTLSLLDTIEGSVRRGADVVRQLLTFARGQPGIRTQLPVRQLLRETSCLLSETFPRNITVHVSVPEDLWCIEADGTQVHQLLMNLCVNARDAMPLGGTLTLSACNRMMSGPDGPDGMRKAEQPWLMVSVSDTGVGMEAAMLGRIFDPFFTTKPLGQGTGLGLSVASGIVRGHGGFITVRSELGHGSCFEVFLPALACAQTKVETPVPARAQSGRGELILIVDDESCVRQMLERTLKRSGYRVISSRDGAEALNVFLQRMDEIDVVLTDMMMPGLGGTDLAARVHSHAPSLPIIGMTGLQEQSLVDGKTDPNLTALLLKPFGVDMLLQVLERCLCRT